MRLNVTVLIILLLVAFATPASAVTIPTIPIGNAGNAADPETGFGAVSYNYRIGTTEVTNAQYTEFLNAVAATDPNFLYHTSMGSSTRGGITRSGTSGNYTYSVKTAAIGAGPGGTDYTYENKPVIYVSFLDAMRFTNWLHNGQGSGDTETGAYTIGDGVNEVRSASAKYWIPSEDEWYKAAYHDASAGTTGTYFDYATSTDSTPDNNLPSADSGNSANFTDGDLTTGDFDYPMTDAGAYTLSASPYGTFDQGGNVWELNEAVTLPSSRGLRGGSWVWDSSYLRPDISFINFANGSSAEYGFRVATVPEPSAAVLSAFGVVGLAAWGWRRRTFRMKCLFAVIIALFCIGSSALAVTIPTVPVGDPGNAGELSGAGAGGFGPDAIVGGVAYDYRIGTTEVTNAQYAEFLNAVAATDTYELYNLAMGSSSLGGITRTGSSGSYSYAVKGDAGAYTYGNKPVVFVNWYDAIRFANWLHNGQGSGDTETGAYTVLGGTPLPTNPNSIPRNPGAKWFLTSEDEWHKAAYYDGSTYYDYPTGTDTTPDNNLPTADSGNSANFEDSGYTTGDGSYPLTDAGAYAISGSHYGTFDQGGNVWEWNETLISAGSRGLRGGSWQTISGNLHAAGRGGFSAYVNEVADTGFRVATVPEPSTLSLAAFGFLALAPSGWRLLAKIAS